MRKVPLNTSRTSLQVVYKYAIKRKTRKNGAPYFPKKTNPIARALYWPLNILEINELSKDLDQNPGAALGLLLNLEQSVGIDLGQASVGRRTVQ